MSLMVYKLFAALLTWIVTLVAVIYPIKMHADPHHHHFLDLGDAFASGVFLGAALFHLLPESSEYFREIYPAYPMASLLCAGGFCLLLFLERLSLSTKKNSHNHLMIIPYILALVIMVHSIIEGAVVGINTEIAMATLIFIAVIAHKGSESFALSVILIRSTLSRRAVMTLIFIFSLMTPIGIGLGAIGSSFLHGQKGIFIANCFNAFAAGTFLYMSTLHHISHHQRLHEAESLVEFIFLFAGVVVMAGIAIWV